MSWSVEIVTVPIADDDDDAWQQLDEIREEEEDREYGSPPSDPMMNLYRRLTARYPCIMENPDSPWSDGPLVNNFGDQLTTLGIVSTRLEETLPFVVETATEMGFTVFDAADERIYRSKNWNPRPDDAHEEPSQRQWWKFWR